MKSILAVTAIVSITVAVMLFIGILMISQQTLESTCKWTNETRGEVNRRVPGDYELSDDVHDQKAKKYFGYVPIISCDRIPLVP
jgi:hypothetical protein